MARTLVYFRGLNTFGSDQFQIGPLRFGLAWKHLEAELRQRDLDFYPVQGMDAGTIEKQTARAMERLEDFFDRQQPANPVHFLAHSAGGIVAKKILSDRPDWGKRVRSLITIATPHHGSHVGQLAKRAGQRSSLTKTVFLWAGYNLERRVEIFDSLENVADRLKDFRPGNEIFCGSIVCAPPREEWNVCYRLLHRLPQFRGWDEPSDGLVEKNSQIFGEILGEFMLDHAQQLGFFGRGKEFERLCDRIAEVVRGL